MYSIQQRPASPNDLRLCGEAARMKYPEEKGSEGLVTVQGKLRNVQPLVSVIIPVYNGAEFVVEAIESAARQTYRNLEIIVVDDGSTDGTLKLLQHYAGKEPRLRILNQANGGVASARNHAIAEAAGELIAPLDADDLWLPDKIERQVKCLLAAGEDTGFVYSWWAWIDEAGMVLDRSPRWTIAGNKLEELILINFTGNASVPLFRKRCLLEAGGYNSELAAANAGGCEDWEVVLRVAARHRIGVVEDVLLGYRRRPGSMSQAYDAMWRSQQMVMRGIRELRPELTPALFKGSENQFLMYLAGLSFWSGDIRQAIGWGTRAGLRLPVLVAPWVLKMLLLRGRKPKARLVMRPGVLIETKLIPNPLLPYDVALSPARHLGRMLGPFWALVRMSRETAQRSLHALLLMRMRREAARSSTTSADRKLRVMATACWHFPIYSQTFVYREVLALVANGFDLCFLYGGLTSRRQLPDDLMGLWKLKRRILYAERTASDDFHYFQGIKPEKVAQIRRSISEASGLSEQEVNAHPHFRHAFSFARMAEAWQPDYIHTYFFYEQALFGYVASTLLGIPRGVSCYADHMMQDYELKLVGLHTATCDVVVATSARIKRELEAIAGVPLPNAIVKPNGIDAGSFEAAARPPSSDGRVLRGVAVNRIHPKKGVTYLVEAVLLLRDRGVPFVLDVLGDCDEHDPDGPGYLEQLKRFVADHQLESSINFRGRQTAPEVRRYLAVADIFVAPFVELPNGDKDGIPTALLEAMAAGCAVVATDAGSITEVIDDSIEGLFVPQCDAGALANAIERLALDGGLRTELARNAVARARGQFDVNVCEAIFHERVRQAVERRQNVAHPREAIARIERGAGFTPMKIALLSYEYPAETGFGGIGTYTWYHARALVKLGHEVHVLAGAARPRALRTSVEDGVIVHRYRASDAVMLLAALFGVLKCFWTQRRIENAWCMYLGLRRLRKQHRFDVIEMPECGGEGALNNWLIDTPTVVRFHGPSRLIMPFYDVPRMDVAVCSWIEQIGIRHATALTSCSEYVAAEAHEKMGVGQHITCFGNGIDLDLFDEEQPANLSERYGIPAGQTTILFAGRMERRKGIELCAEIVSAILRERDVTFLFAGEDLFGYVEQVVKPALLAQNLLGSFLYLGKLGLQELRACARAVDIYFLPSQWENCPYACLEAMAAARAIVCSNQGGMPELIQHEANGLLAEAGSPQAYINGLKRLIDDPCLRARLGQAARETIEQSYTDVQIGRRTELIYRRYIGAVSAR
jgi:glycosyltransferase involved in cell wall biosynthesis